MPIHDWTRVDHGTFHDFHCGWVATIRSVLNSEVLPPDHSAVIDSAEAGADAYAKLRKTVVIRRGDDQVVALIEIMSPGNKSNRHGIRAFVEKVTDAIGHGLHVVVIDLFPPGPRDPDGIHPAIWTEFRDEPYTQPRDRPLTLASYDAGPITRAYVQPVAVGQVLPDMPLFLAPAQYVRVPLEATYAEAFRGIPKRVRDLLSS